MATSSEVVSDSKSRSWSSEANWTVSGGSIDSLITVESMDSPIDFEAVDTNDKSPLVLIPPSSDDPGPCEIKINFAQKHEVRQVYVRSTARIFEIYLAPSLRSNEYLCTVRCGIAARDDGVLHATQTGEHGANSSGSAGKQAKGRSNDGGNSPANEDDWIEVKVPDSSSQDNQHKSMPRNDNQNTEACCQDLYEATAEITDADACISLTLRLLSLQTKDWVYVDEIYVFADPVDSTDTETQVPEVGSSAGTSLMAMLVPTLLNLSKSGNIQKQNKQTFDPKERDDSQGVAVHVPHSTVTASEIQKDEVIGTRQEVTEDAHESPHLQIPRQAADTGQNTKLDDERNLPRDQIASTLELLLSRVSRIEDICSSFEQSMLKPIISIEGRLQRVEEQVQILSKNAQRSTMPPSTRIASSSNDEGSAENAQPSAMPHHPSTRISAPSFSSTDSITFNHEGKKYPACGAHSGKKDSPVEVSSNSPVFIPSLVVTAPEFSCGDEESDDDFEPKEDCPKEIKKQSLSIDDALAAALAGFISTSAPPSHDVPTLTFKAPEFAVEEDSDDSTLASPSATHAGFISATSAPRSHYVQTLTVKAPEFTVDEDGDDTTLASPSAALAGFAFGTSAMPSHYVQTLTVKAPEFTVDEDGDDTTLSSPSAAVAGFAFGTSGTPSHYVQTLTVKAPEFRVDEDGGDSTSASPSAAPAGFAFATSASPSHNVQTLTVKAPEFTVDEDGDGCTSASPSAAPAGFISATSAPPSHYDQTLTVKAPEFTVDEAGDDTTLASPSAQSGKDVILSGVPYESDPPRYENDSASSSRTIPILPATENRVADSHDNSLEDTFEGVAQEVKFDCSQGINIDHQTTQPELRLAQTNDSQIVEATSKEEATDVSVVSNSERSDILQQFPEVPIEDTCKIADESAAETADDVVEGSEEANPKGEDNNASIVSNSERSDIPQLFPGVLTEDTCKTVEGSEEDVSAEVVKSSSTSCRVDFEFPILDVKFVSSGLPVADSHVETLLADVPENKVETHCIVDENDLQNLLVDWDSDYVRAVPSGTEGEESSVNAFGCELETDLLALI